jgi:hypothetical protein
MATDLLTQLRPQMPYFLVLLIGIVIGILYLHYAWKAPEKGVKMLESPKLKNLLWVLGGAFVTFAADFKAIDPNADKAILFYVYGGSALATFLLGWILCGGWIAIKTTWIKLRSPAQYPGEPFHPVFDFLFHSYEHYQKQFKLGQEAQNKTTADRYKEWTDRFLPLYSGNLVLCLQTAQTRLTHGKVHTAEISVMLSALCAVILSIYEDKERDIHARFLRSFPNGQTGTREFSSTEEEALKKLRFARADSSKYEHFLTLEAANLDAKAEAITLPVESLGNSNRSLPGAPMAFATGEDQLDDDIDKMKHSDGLDRETEKQVRDYFKKRGIHSLSSFVLRSPFDQRAFGVLTIESSHGHCLGETIERQKELRKLLRPFVSALEMATAP